MKRDRWAEWLLERRFAGGKRPSEDFMRHHYGVRDQVLANAAHVDGITLLDVGCGDGLIGFGALERGAGLVIFADVSDELLEYVDGKCRAFEEFFRVLRPGRRISLFEPINRLSNFFSTYAVGPVQALFSRVQEVFEQIQSPETDPMLNFDERGLVDLAVQAGFEEVYVRLDIKSKPPRPRPWKMYLDSVGNPKVPSFAEAME